MAAREHAEHEREMDDATRPRPRLAVCSICKTTIGAGPGDPQQIDGEGDEHVQATECHAAPVDAGQIALAVWSSMNRMTPRNRPCAAVKTRLVTRNPRRKVVCERAPFDFGAWYLTCPRRGLNRRWATIRAETKKHAATVSNQ